MNLFHWQGGRNCGKEGVNKSIKKHLQKKSPQRGRPNKEKPIWSGHQPVRRKCSSLLGNSVGGKASDITKTPLKNNSPIKPNKKGFGKDLPHCEQVLSKKKQKIKKVRWLAKGVPPLRKKKKKPINVFQKEKLSRIRRFREKKRVAAQRMFSGGGGSLEKDGWIAACSFGSKKNKGPKVDRMRPHTKKTCPRGGKSGRCRSTVPFREKGKNIKWRSKGHPGLETPPVGCEHQYKKGVLKT